MTEPHNLASWHGYSRCFPCIYVHLVIPSAFVRTFAEGKRSTAKNCAIKWTVSKIRHPHVLCARTVVNAWPLYSLCLWEYSVRWCSVVQPRATVLNTLRAGVDRRVYPNASLFRIRLSGYQRYFFLLFVYSQWAFECFKPQRYHLRLIPNTKYHL